MKKSKKIKKILFRTLIVFNFLMLGVSIATNCFPAEADYLLAILFDETYYKNVSEIKNEYFVEEDFDYFQNIETFHPKNKQELMNVVRTAANSGVGKISFYCAKSYTNWLDDVKKIQDGDHEVIGFIHPFNEYSTIQTFYNTTTRRVEIVFTRKYTDEQINAVKKEIDRLYDEIYDESLSAQANIELFNNYIIEHTEYDHPRADDGDKTYASDTAYGVLFEGKGICTGYTDTMYLFIEKLGLEQFRVINDIHIWNVVKIDGEWKHLDVTWNDMEKEFQNLFVLVDTEKLWRLNKDEHGFNQEIFTEVAFEETDVNPE